MESWTKQQVLEARMHLSEVLGELDQLSRQVADRVLYDEDVAIDWAWKGLGGRFIAETIRRLDYFDDQLHQNTRLCPAVIRAPDDLLEQVKQLNALRLDLKDQLQLMDRVKPDGSLLTTVNTRGSLTKLSLKQLRHVRLNRKQATRQMKVIENHPHRLSYYWARHRKIQRITQPQAIDRLNKARLRHLNNDDICEAIESDLELVAALGVDTALALIFPPHIHPQVNIHCRDSDGKVFETRARGTLPLWISTHTGLDELEIKPLTDDPGHQRRGHPRMDTLWAQAPFIQSLNLYRHR